MMFHHNLKDLSLAAMAWSSLPKEDQDNLVKLVKVYFDALRNPPEGIIGVGAITYAEQQLLIAQGAEKKDHIIWFEQSDGNRNLVDTFLTKKSAKGFIKRDKTFDDEGLYWEEYEVEQ